MSIINALHELCTGCAGSGKFPIRHMVVICGEMISYLEDTRDGEEIIIEEEGSYDEGTYLIKIWECYYGTLIFNQKEKSLVIEPWDEDAWNATWAATMGKD